MPAAAAGPESAPECCVAPADCSADALTPIMQVIDQDSEESVGKSIHVGFDMSEIQGGSCGPELPSAAVGTQGGQRTKGLFMMWIMFSDGWYGYGHR